MSDLSIRQAAERERQSLHDQEVYRLEKRITELEQALAEKERENGLLRAVAESSNDLRHFVATNQDEQPYNEFIHKLITMAAKLEAAIDAGALEGE